MFSALKKLTRGGDDRLPGAAPARMPSSLQKKFSRGVHYNMKILIKGDRNVGKSCLLQRLQGGPFIEDYIPTEQIQAAAIHWTYKNTDHIVKVEVWEVVDKARSRKRAPPGLKLDNASSGAAGEAGEGGDDDAPALDATFLDVYKDASGVILMMDITKPWTYEYVVKELSNVPVDLPLVLLGNHCDMQHHRQVHPHHLEQALQQARQTRTAPVRYAEASMRNGFGLRLLHKFLSVPFLRLQRASLLQQLQRNQLDARDAEQELDQFQSSEESNYVLFVERLASKRRAGGGACGGAGGGAAAADRSPSIVLGAGKPILPPNTNPLHAMSLSSPSARADSPPPPAQRTPSHYVSAELLAPTSPPPQPPPPPPAHSRRPRDSPVSQTSASGGALDEFYAGALDTSFLEDPPQPPQPPPSDRHPTHDTDSDNDSSGNPMVASTQDEPDELETAAEAWPWRRSREVERLMSRASLAGAAGGAGDATAAAAAAAAPPHYEPWAGAARRSPEGGEDASVPTEAHSIKEERKHKKSKKSKDKEKEEGRDKSEHKEKKHKHKKSKSERRDVEHPQCGLLLPTELPASTDQYDSI